MLYFMLFRLVRETNIQEIIPFANPLLPKKKHGNKYLPYGSEKPATEI